MPWPKNGEIFAPGFLSKLPGDIKSRRPNPQPQDTQALPSKVFLEWELQLAEHKGHRKQLFHPRRTLNCQVTFPNTAVIPCPQPSLRASSPRPAGLAVGLRLHPNRATCSCRTQCSYLQTPETSELTFSGSIIWVSESAACAS